MKKVRFETPNKGLRITMDENECHSPRPFIDKQETCRPELAYNYPRLLPYNPDPVLRYECSNSSPYPIVAKTSIDKACDPGSRWPSNDLELSMLDSSHCEPRQPMLPKQQIFCNKPVENTFSKGMNNIFNVTPKSASPNILQSIENTKLARSLGNNIEENKFFIKRDNLNKLYPTGHINSLQSQLNRLSLDKEIDPLAKKAELIQISANTETFATIKPKVIHEPIIEPLTVPDECRCHHCVKIIQNGQCSLQKPVVANNPRSCQIAERFPRLEQHCSCMQARPEHPCACNHYIPVKQPTSSCSCHQTNELANNTTPKNGVDKKAWMIEKYKHNQNHDRMEVEKPTSVVKEKREPTVSDLFKIIKLQNEQLQLLQEKVDKFISSSTSINTPIQNYMTEHVALETLDTEQHKISIGVMTSFEMVRTSTVINKEMMSQTHENAQIQCNRSQISIKEVVSKAQPVTLNFLDGISPASKAAFVNTDNNAYRQTGNFCEAMQQTENNIDDKTLNEFSLCNVQVDNATTPLISPEQSLYLDVRDYSDSDSSSEDQSNVGWTYYNKVMNHVNGVLQDSEMPSSASALFRNTRQQCVQMQIDKTNVSVTKRVKFGDDPLGIHQPHLYTATDTSLKMNQLAAKYLKGAALPPAPVPPPVYKPSSMPIEMSFATRNYMERHRILQGNAIASRAPPTGEIPRFLDITALKQQPKLL